MANMACSAGCWICRQRGEGGQHSSGCCGSVLCDHSAWKEQTRKWLEAEKLWKDKVLTRWLLAEQVYQAQQEAAEQEARKAATIQALAAARRDEELRSKLTVKAAKRVNVAAPQNSPAVAKQRTMARHS